MRPHDVVFTISLIAILIQKAAGHAAEPSCASEKASSSVLRVVLVRHAESFNNVLNLVSHDYYRDNRLADPPITTLGEEQAGAAARFISESRSGLMQHISEVHISPTLRTLQTARPIMARLPGVRAEVVLDIFEVGGVYNANVTSGEAEGQPGVARAAMSEFGYGLPDGVTEDGWYAREHGKETKAEGVARASKVAARLRETAAALPTARKTIALVSHGDFIGMLLANLLGHGRGDASVGLAFKVRARTAARRAHPARRRARRRAAIGRLASHRAGV